MGLSFHFFLKLKPRCFLFLLKLSGPTRKMKGVVMSERKFIDITDVGFVKFVKKVYQLSCCQEMGMHQLSFKPLTDEEAYKLISDISDMDGCIVNLDYVRGRACKMKVEVKNDRLMISNPWLDHTDAKFAELLSFVGIEDVKFGEHSRGCVCFDCQDKRQQGK